jgi:hypothetical protein
MLSSHLALPREGHLAQTFHVFAYLKKYHNTEMVFDPSDPVIDESVFGQQDWTSSKFGHVAGDWRRGSSCQHATTKRVGIRYLGQSRC